MTFEKLENHCRHYESMAFDISKKISRLDSLHEKIIKSWAKVLKKSYIKENDSFVIGGDLLSFLRKIFYTKRIHYSRYERADQNAMISVALTHLFSMSHPNEEKWKSTHHFCGCVNWKDVTRVQVPSELNDCIKYFLYCAFERECSEIVISLSKDKSCIDFKSFDELGTMQHFASLCPFSSYSEHDPYKIRLNSN